MKYLKYTTLLPFSHGIKNEHELDVNLFKEFHIPLSLLDNSNEEVNKINRNLLENLDRAKQDFLNSDKKYQSNLISIKQKLNNEFKDREKQIDKEEKKVDAQFNELLSEGHKLQIPPSFLEKDSKSVIPESSPDDQVGLSSMNFGNLNIDPKIANTVDRFNEFLSDHYTHNEPITRDEYQSWVNSLGDIDTSSLSDSEYSGDFSDYSSIPKGSLVDRGDKHRSSYNSDKNVFDVTGDFNEVPHIPKIYHSKYLENLRKKKEAEDGASPSLLETHHKDEDEEPVFHEEESNDEMSAEDSSVDDDNRVKESPRKKKSVKFTPDSDDTTDDGEDTSGLEEDVNRQINNKSEKKKSKSKSFASPSLDDNLIDTDTSDTESPMDDSTTTSDNSDLDSGAEPVLLAKKLSHDQAHFHYSDKHRHHRRHRNHASILQKDDSEEEEEEENPDESMGEFHETKETSPRETSESGPNDTDDNSSNDTSDTSSNDENDESDGETDKNNETALSENIDNKELERDTEKELASLHNDLMDAEKNEKKLRGSKAVQELLEGDENSQLGASLERSQSFLKNGDTE